MALTVSSDLAVKMSADQNETKLIERKQALRNSIQRGEPKAIGVMLGLMIISYSIPLLKAERTEVLMFGVPWWSSVTFVTAGTVALVMEKRKTMALFFACLMISVAAVFISAIALIIYMVDIVKHPIVTCNNDDDSCEPVYSNNMSVEMKSILLLLHIVQMAVSSVFSFILYKEKKMLNTYMLMN